MKILFLFLISFNKIILDDKFYQRLVENKWTFYNAKLNYKFQIKISRFKKITYKLETLLLDLKKKKLSNFEEFFMWIKNDIGLLKFFYNKSLKSYLYILEQLLKKKIYKDGYYNNLKQQLIFFKNNKLAKENEFYFSPYWRIDESYEKYGILFYEIISNFIDFKESFYLNISLKKLNVEKNLELIYSNYEIFNYPIIFNYYFFPKIKLENEIDELLFYKEFYSNNKENINKDYMFQLYKNGLTFKEYKIKNGMNKIFDNFLLFNRNLINTLNEYIIINSTETLEKNKMFVYVFDKEDIYLNNDKIIGKNYYQLIPKIFKIQFNDEKDTYKYIIDKKDCYIYDSCYFTYLFQENFKFGFNLIVKYYNIYYLFYEAQLFELKGFSKDIKNIIIAFSKEKLDITDKELNILINKILFEFDLNNKEEIIIKIKYFLSYILQYFNDKFFSNENQKSLFEYFYKSKMMNKFLIRKYNKNININYIIKKDEELNYFILYDIVYKVFIKHYNKQKNSIVHILMYLIRDKINQIKLFLEDFIKTIKATGFNLKNISSIVVNIEFLSNFFSSYYNIFNITNSIIKNSLIKFLQKSVYIVNDLKNIINNLTFSKLIFENYNDYANKIFLIFNGKDINEFNKSIIEDSFKNYLKNIRNKKQNNDKLKNQKLNNEIQENNKSKIQNPNIKISINNNISFKNNNDLKKMKKYKIFDDNNINFKKINSLKKLNNYKIFDNNKINPNNNINQKINNDKSELIINKKNIYNNNKENIITNKNIINKCNKSNNNCSKKYNNNKL